VRAPWNGLRHGAHARDRGAEERLDVAALDIHVDGPSAAESPEQGCPACERDGVRKTGQDVAVERLDHGIDVGAVCGARAQESAVAEHAEEIAFEPWLPLALEMLHHPGVDDVHELRLRGGHADAGRRQDEAEDEVLPPFGQVIGFGQQRDGEADCGQGQAGDDAVAPLPGVREPHDERRAVVPPVRVRVRERDISQPVVRRGGNHGDGDEQGGDHGNRDGEREIRKQLPRDVAQEHDWQENRHRGRRRGDERAPHLGRALQGRLVARLAGLAQPHDVLEHDDGGVQHHADGERQAREADDVDGAPSGVQRDERDQQRDGNGQRHHQGRAPAAQEPP
jgi:hypothetical protein